MADSRIMVGDVCHDLVKNGKVQVVSLAASSVQEHREANDYDVSEYKANATLGVADDEPVFKCVYLSDGPTASFSKAYDFPRSRLAREPAENAEEGLRRTQHRVIADTLEALFATAAADDMASSPEAIYDVATHAGIPEDLVDEARELADVEAWFEEEDDG